MGEIFKQYAGAILVGVAFGALMAIFFVAWPSGSILTDTGNRTTHAMESHAVNWDDQADADAFNTHASRNSPTVVVSKHLVERSDVKLSDFLTIQDCDGNAWDSDAHVFSDGGSGTVDILSVKNTKGEEFIDRGIYDANTQTFHFPEADTYVVKIRVQDSDNVESTCRVPIAVDMEKPAREGE